MLQFTIITELGRPAAIILDAEPAPTQRATLFSLLPGNAFSHPDLAERWNVAGVLGSIDWASNQRHRQPLLRPRGSRLAILARLLSSFIIHTSSFSPPPPAGAGAADLLAKPAAASVPSLPFLPSVVVVPDTNPPPVYYFSLRPQNSPNCALSLVFTNTGASNRITLAWDWGTNWLCANPPTNAYSNFLAWGETLDAMTNIVNAGTNSSITVTLIPPPLTNRLIQVTTVSATNLQWSLTPRGPWTSLNVTNWTATNPPAPRYFRALGARRSAPGRATIKSTQF